MKYKIQGKIYEAVAFEQLPEMGNLLKRLFRVVRE